MRQRCTANVKTASTQTEVLTSQANEQTSGFTEKKVAFILRVINDFMRSRRRNN
jgi:hypothetical protein